MAVRRTISKSRAQSPLAGGGRAPTCLGSRCGEVPVDDSSTKPTPPWGPRLVEQDIQLTREPRAGALRVIARVECVRRGCGMEVEDCGRCAHFVRIETHEAGYVLLCRADHEDAAAAPEKEDEPI